MILSLEQGTWSSLASCRNKIRDIYSKKNRKFYSDNNLRQSTQSELGAEPTSVYGSTESYTMINEDQKMQYYLNIEKNTRPTDIVSYSRG